MRKDYLMNFGFGMHKGISDYSSDIELVNYYNTFTPDERAKAPLMDIAGSKITHLMDVDEGTGCRGLWLSSTGSPSSGYTSTLYGVFGNTLFRITKNDYIKIGKINSKINLVSFAENQDQTELTLGYVCDGTVYQWDLKAEDADVANSFAEINELPQIIGDNRAIAKYISYNSYRLILTTENAIQWYYSKPNSNEWAGFESSESNPDKTVRAINFGNNIWVFSNYSYDIFSYTSNSDDPYDVSPGATGKIGCANGDTIAIIGDRMFWLAQGERSDDSVYMATVGGQMQEITTAGIKNILRTWKYKPYAKAFAFSDRGQTFYCLTSKSDDYTLVYCLETNTWHRRSTSIDGKVHFWDVINVINYNNKLYFGTNNSNNLCEFDYESIVDHNGYPITRFTQIPVIIENLDNFKLLEYKLDCEVGIGNSNSEVFVQIGWDNHWGERMVRPLGKLGNYKQQIQFLGMGSGRNLVIRIGTSATRPVTLYQARIVYDGARRT